eukprot:XP_001701524.1 predicted protein [Chlamydomonas reinhardtii]
MARLQSILALIAVALLASGAAATQNDCLGGCASSHPSFEPVCCDGRMWYNACYMLCQAPNITLYERCPSPSPSPAPSPSPSRPPCDPLTYPYVNQTYHCQSDCRTYTLVDVNAGCMPNWAGARAYCESRGLELAPWDTDASNGALHTLCAANRYTCWAAGSMPDGLCPVMSQEGDMHFQGCNQPVRFVCRTTSALYKLCRDNRYTCWTGGRDDSTDLCPLMTQEGYIVQQGCEQSVRWVCRTKGCEANCDVRYPNWYVWVCGKDGQAYRNWCYAACHGCYLYTPCSAPGDSNEPVIGDNVLSLTDGGYLYRMWTVDAKQRRTYAGADAFCTGLGSGWGLVPYTDLAGYGAVRRLCANNAFTCWLKRGERDDNYPLMAADGTLQMQGPNQEVRFVCRQQQ